MSLPAEPDRAAAPDSGRLARASLGVAAGTALSRLTGLARVGVTAYAIGRSTLADTYNLANTTPNIVYELILGGVLTATLIPLFVEQMHRSDDRSTSAVVTVAVTALTALAVLATILAPALAWLYTVAGHSEHLEAQREVATLLIRLLVPQILFYGITALASALLNARRRYLAAAFAPVLNNLVVIATFLWFVAATDGPRSSWVGVESVRGDTGLLLLLGLGTTAGIAAMAVALLPALRAAGVRLRPAFDWTHPDVRRLLRLSGWTVGYVIANQIALSVVLVLANRRSGGVAAYQYAFIFFQLPHGLFAVSIMTTFTPELARCAAAGDLAAYRARFALGLRYLGLVILPAAAAFFVLARPMVGLLERGGFAASDVRVTGDTLQALALALPAFSAYLYTLRGFYALSDTRTPFFINFFENSVNVVLALLLFPRFGVQGLALAYAAAYSLAAVVALRLLAGRTGGLGGDDTGAALSRAAVAAVASGVAGALVAGAVEAPGALRALATLAAAGTAAGTVYVLALRGLGVHDLTPLVRSLRERRDTTPSDV